MLQEALDELHIIFKKPAKSLKELQDAFVLFEKKGPFKDDINFQKILNVTDRNALFTEDHSYTSNPWYPYVLKRIAIPEWFYKMQKIIDASKTVEQWAENNRLYDWDNLLGDLVNKAPHQDEESGTYGMCEDFRSTLTSWIEKLSFGDKTESLIPIREKLDIFIKDMKSLRDQYRNFREFRIN